MARKSTIEHHFVRDWDEKNLWKIERGHFGTKIRVKCPSFWSKPPVADPFAYQPPQAVIAPFDIGLKVIFTNADFSPLGLD